MNKYLIMAKRHLEEVEGYGYEHDQRLFIVPYEDVFFLFDKATGTLIADTFDEGAFEREKDSIVANMDKIVKTKLYAKNIKKFNKYFAQERVVYLCN